jgi:uncharacterized protein (DUF488 family)
MSEPNTVIYTVGHSTHRQEDFIGLLRKHSITALADVRSHPFSRHNPQFNKDVLAPALKHTGIVYVFVGKELGARSNDPACYEHGRVQYSRLARTPIFESGIDRVIKGARHHRVVLMCAEKEPLDCHRTLLVSRALEKHGATVRHILAGGQVEDHADTMMRLLDMVGVPREDMFRTREELVSEACAQRELKTAYTEVEFAGTKQRFR